MATFQVNDCFRQHANNVKQHLNQVKFSEKIFLEIAQNRENSLFNFACERGKIEQNYAETGNQVTKVRKKKIQENKLNGLYNRT